MTVVKEFELDSISDYLDFCWSGAIPVIREFEERGLDDEFISHMESEFEYKLINGEPITDDDINNYIWLDLPSKDFYKNLIKE